MRINALSSSQPQMKNSQVGFTARMPEKSINNLYDVVKDDTTNKAKLYVLLKYLDKYPKGYINFDAKGFGCSGVQFPSKSIFGKTHFHHVDRALTAYSPRLGSSIVTSTQKHEKGSLFDFLEGTLVNKPSKMNIKIRGHESFKPLSVKDYYNKYAEVLKSGQSLEREDFLKFAYS